MLLTAAPNTFKEISLPFLRAIVKTDNLLMLQTLYFMAFGCFNEFCRVQFREGDQALRIINCEHKLLGIFPPKTGYGLHWHKLRQYFPLFIGCSSTSAIPSDIDCM